MNYPIRTRFAKDIVCEVMLPEKQTGKVAIVCGGAPGFPPRVKTIAFLASKGYVAIGMRYRGAWESEGVFLKHSPAKDVADIITELTSKKKVYDIEKQEWIPLQIKRLDLFGGSFGGPAVLLNSKNKYVRKVIALAPVIDFHNCGPEETFEEYIRFSEQAFGGAYRVEKKSDWQKLLRKDFYNPITMVGDVDVKKCFILQCLDDLVCLPENTKAFEKKTDILVYYKPKGGHIGTSRILHDFYWKKIESFLNKM